MNKILYYPIDGDHFVDMYLDKVKYAGLIARHDLYERYMHGKLTDEEVELDCFKGPYAGVAWDYSILKNRIFHAAVQSFSDELCRRFAGRCVENFYAAPGGKEEEWIKSTPTPNIYEYGQYERLNGWYGALALMIEGIFGKKKKAEE